jgi:hypothetical protein
MMIKFTDGTSFDEGENVLAVHCRVDGDPGNIDVGMDGILDEQIPDERAPKRTPLR